MNKFEFNHGNFVHVFRIYLMITIAIYFAAYVSHTSYIIAYGSVSIISFMFSIKLMFFSKDKNEVSLLLGKSLFLTIGLNILTLCAYYDEWILAL